MDPTPRRIEPRVARRPGAVGFAAVTVVPDAAPAAAPVWAPRAPPTAPHAPSLALVLRAPSGIMADVAGLDVATAVALLRAVLTPTTAGAA